jgi:hypothetical protein
MCRGGVRKEYPLGIPNSALPEYPNNLIRKECVLKWIFQKK